MDDKTITFADTTINDAHGDCIAVGHLMEQDVGERDWMLRSESTVACNGITTNYLLHFWKNGQVYISKTNRPVSLNMPDDDIRYLSEWCRNHGWERLVVDKNLLSDPVSFEFWLRMYQAGIAHSEILEQHDLDEMDRLSKAYDESED